MACYFFSPFPPSLPLCTLSRRRGHVRWKPWNPQCCSEVSPDISAPSNVSTSSTSSSGGGDDYRSTVQALKSRGRFPRKSLGQHYMVNSSINERLASVACVEEGDVILEIGPGTGSLTSVLLESGATVVAVEKDQHMAMLIKDRFGSTDHLMVLQEDFTKCDVGSYISSILNRLRSTGSNPSSAKVVSNIPFNISTDVIKQLLPMGDIFSDVVLLIQDETALRWVNSSSRTSECRPINIFLNFYSEAEYKFKVERKNFFPQPNVDAAVVAFKLKKKTEYPQVKSTKSFFSTVNSAFNSKRKMIRKSLVHLCPSSEIEDALRKLGLPVTSRPEELELDDFVMLHNFLTEL